MWQPINRLCLLLRQRRTQSIDADKAISRTHEGWFCLQSNNEWQVVNQRFTELLGAKTATALRTQWPTVTHLFGQQASAWQNLATSSSWRQLSSVERMDGKTLWLDVEIYSDGQGRALDVTQQVEAEAHLNFLSNHDPLTGLFNRGKLQRLLQQRIDEQQATTLLVIDICGLQVVEDQLGEQSRNQALLQLVLLIQEKLPTTARIARLADRQLAVLVQAPEQAGFSLAHQLLQRCREFRYSAEQKVFQFTANAGIVERTDETINALTMMSRAIDALRLAQQLGSGRVHSAEPTDQYRLEKNQHKDWEQRLREALAGEHWQLYQQPIVSARRDNDKHYFEVLLRLPQYGADRTDEAIAPQQFLKAALQAGVMGKVDRWLIQKVLQDFNADPFAVLRTGRCHINLSSQSILDSDFSHFIAQQLEHTDIEPHQLAFELSEPDIADNFDAAYELFKQLRSFGCVTVIDQFGVGFNSFLLLRQLPVDQIKVNRFWVQNMLLDPLEAQLVKACLGVAEVAKVEVCAVGVENQETRTALLKEQVDFVQGYACGAPYRWSFDK